MNVLTADARRRLLAGRYTLLWGVIWFALAVRVTDGITAPVLLLGVVLLYRVFLLRRSGGEQS